MSLRYPSQPKSILGPQAAQFKEIGRQEIGLQKHCHSMGAGRQVLVSGENMGGGRGITLKESRIGFQVEIPQGAKSLNITLAVTRLRRVEFLAKPAPFGGHTNSVDEVRALVQADLEPQQSGLHVADLHALPK